MKIDWKKIVGGVAPAIASMFGGPLAGTAVAVLSESLLGKPDGTEAELAQVIASGSPDVLLKIKEADNTFKVRMSEIGLDYEKIGRADRDSARKRESEVKDIMPKVLAILAVVGFYGVAIGLLFVAIPPGKENIIYLFAGALIATFKDVYGYYFGSSSGSNQKNAILDRVIKGG